MAHYDKVKNLEIRNIIRTVELYLSFTDERELYTVEELNYVI